VGRAAADDLTASRQPVVGWSAGRKIFPIADR
jgi:hypothetical protein